MLDPKVAMNKGGEAGWKNSPGDVWRTDAGLPTQIKEIIILWLSLLMQAQNLIIRFSSKCQGRNVC